MTHTFQPTPEQLEIIEYGDGAQLVIAPPGTGKTQVLTQRIVHLLRADPEGSFRVLALAFTTKAAETVRERVRTALGELARRVSALTFHAFCEDVLRHYGDSVGFSIDTSVFENEEDRMGALVQGRKEEGLPLLEDSRLRSMLAEIYKLKRDLTPPETAPNPELAISYAAYDRVLRRNHACDFDDLLWLTWRLFTESPRVARHYRRMYRHILVDEAQDTNRAQYEVLRALCGEDHHNVMLVADDNQAIYRWNGASARWLDTFEHDFSASRQGLTHSFRSATAILSAADQLIRHNPQSEHAPHPEQINAAPGFIGATAFKDETAEAMFVVDQIERLLRDGLEATWSSPTEVSTVLSEQICVLGRNRYSLEPTHRELQKRKIPSIFNAGQRGIVETDEARLVLLLLRALGNPADLVAKDRIVGLMESAGLQPQITGRPSTKELLERMSQHEAHRPFAAAALSWLETGDLTSLVDRLMDAMIQVPTSGEKGLFLHADRRTLRERWEAYRRDRTPEQRSIAGLLGGVALAGRSVVEGPGVRVLTVHAAKGLEFRAVFVVGMNDGTFPDYRSLTGDGLLEERRTAYVAVTRASRALWLTRPRQRQMPWGDLRTQDESRFIQELGLHMGTE